MKGILLFTLVLGLCYKTEGNTNSPTAAAPTTSTTTTATTTTTAETLTTKAPTSTSTDSTTPASEAPTSTSTDSTTPASKAPTSTSTDSTTPASKAPTSTTTASTTTTSKVIPSAGAATTSSVIPSASAATPSSATVTTAADPPTTEAPSSSVTTTATTITGPDGASTKASTPVSGTRNPTSEANSPGSDSTETATVTSQGSDSTETATVTSQGPDSSTSLPPSTQPAKTCQADACGKSGATCTNILGGYICQCPFSYYYNETSSSCTQGKQFFGNVQLNQKYSSELQKTESVEYKKLYDKVQEFFKKCFEQEPKEHGQTVIVKISPTPPKARSSKATTGEATVIEVNNIFRKDSDVNEAVVQKAIEVGQSADTNFSSYKTQTACSIYCDKATTTCMENSSFPYPTCTCKHNYYYTGYPPTTKCSECNPGCTAENSKQCVQIKTNLGAVPACHCLANFEYDKDNKTCVSCSFGYSGEGCKDNFQLILVIVGSIGGALVLALLGGVIGLSVKSKRNNNYSDRQRLIDHEDNPGFGSAVSMDGNHFPRVKVKQAVNGTKPASNPYDTNDPFQVSVPARDYDDDNDSWYEMALKDNRSGQPSRY